MKNKTLSSKIYKLYKDSWLGTRIYLKIRLKLTPFERVAEYIPEKGVVYDLGCGYGIFSNLLNLHSPKRKVIGIDLSKKRIEVANRTVRQRKNIKFIHGNLKDIVLQKCGTIVIYDVLHHMEYPYQENLLRECFEKLGSKGLLVIKDNDTTPRWKYLWNYTHEIITTLFLITKSDKLSFRTKSDFLKLLFKIGFIVEAVNIPTNLPYPFILYICRKAERKKENQGIVFVNPPLSLKERYGSMAKGGRNTPPLGLCSLAAVSRTNGYKTYLIDGPALNYSEADVIKEITEISPAYVGITATTLAIDRAGKMAAKIKKADPRIKTMIGGPHVTALPKETLTEYLSFDFGAIGEGEETLKELLPAIGGSVNLDSIKGLAFRKGRKIIVNERRPFIKDLDTLPIPAWDLLPTLSKYYRSSPQSFNRLPSTSLVTSRGCPNQCTFCDRSVFGNYLRGYSPAYVMKMLKILSHQYEIKHILFDDDTFTILKPRLMEICRLIIKEKLDLTWTCLARVDSVDAPMLKLMKKAGCWQILYGIESGSQQVLDKLQKGITIEEVERALKTTCQAGIRTKGFFILGTPFETRETAEKTIDFMKRIDLDDFHMTYFTPFPGTAIYNHQIKNKKIYQKEWSKMNEWSPVFIPPGFSAPQLIKLSKKAFKEFYFRPRVVVSYLKSAWSTKNFISLLYGINALTQYLFLGSRRK